jgi:proteasome lid subunit RPN8/RPN11
MPPTAKMIASEILICVLSREPHPFPASRLVESIRLEHETLGQAHRQSQIEERLQPSYREQRDRVVEEIRTVLEILRRPDLSGSALAGAVQNLRRLQERGWCPTLFEGLFLGSSYRDELSRSPDQFGWLLEPHDSVNLERGLHVLLDIGETRILELTPFAFAQLLAHQARGIPEPRLRVAAGIWAFPDRDSVESGDPEDYWASWSFTEARHGNRITRPLVIPDDIHGAMVDHCRREVPLMACGILGGLPPRASSFHPLRNAAASEIRHDADPVDLINAVVALRDRGAELLAIYHSNPRWEAVPSQADISENHYGAVPRIIVSLLGPAPTVRVWRLDADSYRELPWRLV